MITAAAAAVDQLAAHPDADRNERRAVLAAVPAAQWGVPGGWWPDLARACPERETVTELPVYFDVTPGGPRCLHRSPDGRGLAWLLSGGDVRSYGACCQAACPRTRGPVTEILP